MSDKTLTVEIDELLFNILPDHKNEKQRKIYINNIISDGEHSLRVEIKKLAWFSKFCVNAPSFGHRQYCYATRN